MSIFIFDDEYIGPRWTYGVTIRPIARFNIPDGWIIDSQNSHPKYRHGTVDYPHRLRDEEVSHYDMVLIIEPEESQ